MTGLVRVQSGDNPADSGELRARLAALESAVTHREWELAKVRSALASFELRYREAVGRLHEELDDLEQAILAAETAAAGGPGESDTECRQSGTHTGRAADPPPRYTTDAVRKLFRDVAKAIHPDLAPDALTRDRRHLLMIEANRAYAAGDEARLRSILEAWAQDSESVDGSAPDELRHRLRQRIEQLEHELGRLTADLTALKETPLWKLKRMVDEAAMRGKDLVRDMVGRLNRDIMVARNRLDAMQSHP